MMSMSYEQVRRRALTQSTLAMRKRRGALRRARWSNSWANLRKLSFKHRFAIKVAALCLVAGLLFGLLGSGLMSRFFPQQVTSGITAVSIPTPIPVLVTPVAASGEEANLNLKLSTELLTNPKGETQ